MRQLASSLPFPYLKRQTTFSTNFWHSGDKSDFLPILQKMQNITIKYTWLREHKQGSKPAAGYL